MARPRRRHLRAPDDQLPRCGLAGIQAKRITWEQISPDVSSIRYDLGHNRAALFVTTYLEQVLKTLPADGQLPAIPAIPSPLFTDLFEHTALIEAPDLKPAPTMAGHSTQRTNAGAARRRAASSNSRHKAGWFNFMFLRVKRAMGNAKVQVDCCPAQNLRACSPDWGGYRVTELLGKNLRRDRIAYGGVTGGKKSAAQVTSS